MQSGKSDNSRILPFDAFLDRKSWGRSAAMNIGDPAKEYRIKEGAKVDLGKIDTDCAKLCPEGNKTNTL